MARRKQKATLDVDGLNKLEAAISVVEKQFGKGTIQMGVPNGDAIGNNLIHTGSYGLDKAITGFIDKGGCPEGRIIEIYGPEASGKTTIAELIAAQYQKLDKQVAFIDAEHALDIEYAASLGVDVDKLLINQPDSGNEALEVAETLARSGMVDLIIIDSVAALIPKQEIEGAVGDSMMGVQAQMLSQALRKLTPIVSKNKCTIIFINQLRCLPLDTLVNENGKLKRLKDIQVGDLVLKDYNQYTKVQNKIHSGIVEGVVLNIKYRGDILMSLNHKNPIVNSSGYKVKQAKDIKIGDWTIHPILNESVISNDIPYIDFSDFESTFSNRVKDGNLYYQGDENLALFLGMYFSDGYLHDDSNNSFINFTENNRERYEIVKNLCEKLFPDFTHTGNNSITIRGLKPVTYLKSIGAIGKGKEKQIPEWIIQSRRDVIKAYIRGCFFDTHGFNSQGFIFTCESEATEIFSYLLYNLGIFADVRADSRKYDRLYITSNDAIKFSKTIEFLEKTKQDASIKFKPSINCRGKYDVVPYILGNVIFKNIRSSISSYAKNYKKANICNHKKLNFNRLNLISLLDSLKRPLTEQQKFWLEFISNNRFSEILDINHTSFEAMDIEVDNGFFIANNLKTHNSKIGVMFGSPEVTTGGNAMKFYASLRLDVRKDKPLDSDYKEITGDDVEDFSIAQARVKVIKNKIAPPFKKCIIPINLNRGVDKEYELYLMATDEGLIKNSGPSYAYKGEVVGKGKLAVINLIRKDSKFRNTLVSDLSQIFKERYDARRNKALGINVDSEDTELENEDNTSENEDSENME